MVLNYQNLSDLSNKRHDFFDLAFRGAFLVYKYWWHKDGTIIVVVEVCTTLFFPLTKDQDNPEKHTQEWR